MQEGFRRRTPRRNPAWCAPGARRRNNVRNRVGEFLDLTLQQGIASLPFKAFRSPTITKCTRSARTDQGHTMDSCLTMWTWRVLEHPGHHYWRPLMRSRAT